MIGIQVAIFDEHVQDSSLVLTRKLLIQGLAIDRFGEQFGNVSAQVGGHSPPHHGVAAKSVKMVEQRPAVVVQEDF